MRQLLTREPRARLFLATHAQSTLGTGAGYVALLVVAYDRFRSPWAITLVLLADFLPSMLFGTLLGAVADRFSRRAAAIAADAMRAIAFIALGLVSSFELTVVCALLAGTGTALFRPAVMAALPSLTRRERVPALTAAYGAIDDTGHTLGPALAAAALLVVSPEALVIANGVSFALSALVLTRIEFGARPLAQAGVAPRESLRRSVREGVRTAAAHRGVATVVLASSAIVLFAGLFNVGELLLATEELGAGSSGFSLLVAIYGAGAVLGSLAGSRGGTGARLRRRYVAGLGLVGVGMLAAGLAPVYAAAILPFAIAGLGNGLVVVHERLLLQRQVPDELLGRVFGLKDSLSSWAFGTAFLAAGALAALVGTRELFLAAGTGALVVCALAWLSFRTEAARASSAAGLPPLEALEGARAKGGEAPEPARASS
jgi:MFS family permease